MSFNNLRSKYSAEEAQTMLEENSDNNESKEETIFDDQPSVSSIFDISSDEEDVYCPSDVSSSSDENEESSRNTPLQFSRNGETWTPVLSARSLRKNPTNIVRVKLGVNLAFPQKAAASPYECWKSFIDNSMLKTIQALTTREARKQNSDFELSLEKLKAFIGLQYVGGIYGKRHPVEFLWNKEYGPKMFCNKMARDCFVKIENFFDLTIKIDDGRKWKMINLCISERYSI